MLCAVATLGGRLKQLRNAAHISQDKLAEELCMSRQAVSLWEIDRSRPDMTMLARIADFFNVTVDFLIGRDELPCLTGEEPAPYDIGYNHQHKFAWLEVHWIDPDGTEHSKPPDLRMIMMLQRVADMNKEDYFDTVTKVLEAGFSKLNVGWKEVPIE